MPEFLKMQRPMFVGAGDQIVASADLDQKRMVNCKSKKARGVHEMMRALAAVDGKAIQNQYSGGVCLSQQINNSTWLRGQKILVKKSNAQDYFSIDEEDQANKNITKISRNEILASFQEAVDQSQAKTTSGPAPNTGIVSSAATGVVTIEEMIRDQEAHVEQIEALADIQNTEMIDALTVDKTQAATGNAALLGSTTTSSMNISQTTADTQGQPQSQSKPQYEYNPDFDIEKLQAEKEEEIKGYVENLDQMKGQIESMKTTYEISYQKKSQFEEEKKEMAEQLKSQQKQAKKNREIVTELQKLSGQDLRILQNQVGELKKELDVLQEEWKEYKKPLTDEINEQKQDITDKKVEYQYKMDKIKDIKKEIKDTIQDLEHKKELLVYLQNQWEKLPQDVNRNQYLKRINEIIANLKAQKVEIKNILGEITDIQKDTDALIEQIKKLDVEVEDYIFNEAKKDKIAKEIYKEITQLKDDFDKLTTNIQEQNKLKSTIREIETKSEDFRIKYKNGVEIQKLVEDLNGIKGENAALQADLQKKGLM